MALKTSATLVAGVVAGLGMATPAFADSGADGAASDSPGILSGNSLQAPVEAPVNACGNTVDAAALLNPAFGNACANASDSTEEEPGGYGDDETPPAQEPTPPTEPEPQSPPPASPPASVPPPEPQPQAELADTGTDPLLIGATAAVGVALLAGGGVLYRRGRTTSR
ncbi:chaplin [Streptomyces sp. O3]